MYANGRHQSKLAHGLFEQINAATASRLGVGLRATTRNSDKAVPWSERPFGILTRALTAVGREGFEPSKLARQIYSLLPLATRAPTRRPEGYRLVRRYCFGMPTFDVVSEVDMQEVRNAVDQANREAATRFDFKGTDSSIELTDKELLLASSTEDRLRALYQVLQEKLVKREVSLKSFDVGKIEEASRGSARQKLTIQAGISSRPRQEDQQVHQGPGPQGGHLPDPGRSAPGQREEARRPAGRDRGAARPRTSVSRCSSTTSGTERSAAGLPDGRSRSPRAQAATGLRPPRPARPVPPAGAPGTAG